MALNRANAELRMRAIQPHEEDAVPAFLATTVNGDTPTIGESAEPAARQVLPSRASESASCAQTGSVALQNGQVVVSTNKTCCKCLL